MINPNEIDLSPVSFNAKVLDALTSAERKNDALVKENAELKAKLQREVIAHHSAQDACADMRDALGMSSPWPITDVLHKLANWCEHLTQVHDCDCHGYEIRMEAVKQAKTTVERLLQALAKLDSKEPK